jgi:hypothetical protein
VGKKAGKRKVLEGGGRITEYVWMNGKMIGRSRVREGGKVEEKRKEDENEKDKKVNVKEGGGGRMEGGGGECHFARKCVVVYGWLKRC